MATIVRPRQEGEYVPGKGYLCHCHNEECPALASFFYSKRPRTRYCCTKCRMAAHYRENQLQLAEARLRMSQIKRNDRILQELHKLFGTAPLSMEVLRRTAFSSEAPSNLVWSDRTKKPGQLFESYILCVEPKTDTFQVYSKGTEYDNA